MHMYGTAGNAGRCGLPQTESVYVEQRIAWKNMSDTLMHSIDVSKQAAA